MGKLQHSCIFSWGDLFKNWVHIPFDTGQGRWVQSNKSSPCWRRLLMRPEKFGTQGNREGREGGVLTPWTPLHKIWKFTKLCFETCIHSLCYHHGHRSPTHANHWPRPSPGSCYQNHIFRSPKTFWSFKTWQIDFYLFFHVLSSQLGIPSFTVHFTIFTSESCTQYHRCYNISVLTDKMGLNLSVGWPCKNIAPGFFCQETSVFWCWIRVPTDYMYINFSQCLNYPQQTWCRLQGRDTTLFGCDIVSKVEMPSRLDGFQGCDSVLNRHDVISKIEGQSSSDVTWFWRLWHSRQQKRCCLRCDSTLVGCDFVLEIETPSTLDVT